MRLIERIWYGNTPLDRATRALLAPFEMLYRGAVEVRSTLYDAGILSATVPPIPVVSVGNVTVGGTGKTPVSAWIAARLKALGRSPAIVLRGYGGDEPLVHERLNPGITVVVDPDRNAAIRKAAAAGANVVVLDDAFQHRRAGRNADIVLVSADDWTGLQHLLPAGPYREPLAALRRASCVVITRKTASDADVAQVTAGVRSAAPRLPLAIVALTADVLVSRDSRRLPLNVLRGRRVFAVAAIGNPTAFFAQISAAGAIVTALPFPDHHSFSAADVSAIIRDSGAAEYVVCTLKDAVKLEQLWPAGDNRLWYVSLAVNVENGEAVIDELLERLH